ncbi:MAG: CheR family methyltransferase [bacterium]
MHQRQADLEGLLDYLKRARGFDFTGYKRPSLERRIARRMQAIGSSSFGDYLDYLEVHPEEFPALFNTILINVTSFFRDAATWDFLRESVIPDVVARREPGVPLRIWSAGCASGEEAYTLAMLFAECLGVDAFRESVKIYATDADEEALAKARQGAYGEREMEDVPTELRDRYFETIEGRSVFRKDLRRQVIFGRHDLVQDAPISRVDMLVCRNTLMYFNAETQARILARFQFALNDHGVLFLGRAETLMTHSTKFSPIDLKRRISSKVPVSNGGVRERLLGLTRQHTNGDQSDDTQAQLRIVALDTIQVAHILVDTTGMFVFANERARSMFGLQATDAGKPFRDLRVSYRPVELRSVLDQAQLDRRPILTKDVEWVSPSGDAKWLDVLVSPLTDPRGDGLLGASITFSDVSVAKRLQRDLQLANEALETAYEELESTNEELETTNEELKSTVEELETTNEELETMNEELQATNEELQAMNRELQERGDELNQANGFLESILASMKGPVIAVDAELKVLVGNSAAQELWGLRKGQRRGTSILDLDIGLPVEQLEQPIRACLAGSTNHATAIVSATSRRGRALMVNVSITPLMASDKTIHGVILLTEEVTVGESA